VETSIVPHHSKRFTPTSLFALAANSLRQKRERDTLPAFDAKQPPPSVIVAPFESGTRFGTGEIVTQVSSRDVGPLPFEGKR
jgi:hypothetical protein